MIEKEVVRFVGATTNKGKKILTYNFIFDIFDLFDKFKNNF